MADSRTNSELKLRTISSFFVALIVIFGIYQGGLIWTVMASLIALISLSEFYGMIANSHEHELERERNRERRKVSVLSPGIGYIFSLIILLAAMKSARPIFIALVLSLEVFAVFVLEIFKRQFSKGESYAVINAGGIILGVLYIAIPWACMILRRDYLLGREILFTLFACTWACDVFAYLGGKAFGRNKLCVYVSPGKTWEGFVVGILGSLIVSAVAVYMFKLPNYMIYIGIICGVAGQFGDLAESLIKRELAVKDSGHLIPGHGGMLDRFDSILINGLLTYLVLEVVL